jgi:hypothetical protein
MRKKTAYNKLFKANDELTEVIENIINEEIRKGNNSAWLEKLTDYIETAADQTQAAMAMLKIKEA